ncbi:unnamed protein product [Amoebophrya sp. A25]|nr:unnamed protein product [Amoebophrya sp. A25]|eukprot:GSA25T00014527001.1
MRLITNYCTALAEFCSLREDLRSRGVVTPIMTSIAWPCRA